MFSPLSCFPPPCMCAHTFTLVGLHRSQRFMSDVSLNYFSTLNFFLRHRDYVLELRPDVFDRLAGQQIPGIHVPLPTDTGIAGPCNRTWPFYSCKESRYLGSKRFTHWAISLLLTCFLSAVWLVIAMRTGLVDKTSKCKEYPEGKWRWLSAYPY